MNASKQQESEHVEGKCRLCGKYTKPYFDFCEDCILIEAERQKAIERIAKDCLQKIRDPRILSGHCSWHFVAEGCITDALKKLSSVLSSHYASKQQELEDTARDLNAAAVHWERKHKEVLAEAALLAATPATPSADEEIETPRILRVEGPHECTRSVNDPKDVHYSVFDETGGNVAHFSKREDAEQYVDLISHANEREELRKKIVYHDSLLDEREANADQIGELATELNEARATLAAREGEIERLKEKVANQAKVWSTELSALQAELETSNKTIQALQEELEYCPACVTAKAELATAQSELEEWRTERDGLLRELADKDSDLATAQKERDEARIDFEGRKASEEASVRELNEQLEANDTLRSQLTEAQKRFQDSTEWAMKTEAELTEAQAERDEFARRWKEINRQLGVSQVQLSEANAKLAEAVERVNRAEKTSADWMAFNAAQSERIKVTLARLSDGSDRDPTVSMVRRIITNILDNVSAGL